MFGLSRVCRNGLERSGAASDARSGVGCLERRRMPGAALETLGGVGCLKQRRTLEMASDAWSGVGHLACCRQSGRLRARQAAYKLRLRIFRAGAFVRRARSLSARRPGTRPAVPQAGRLPIPDVSVRRPFLLFLRSLPAASIIAPLRAPPPPCAGARTTDSP